MRIGSGKSSGIGSERAAAVETIIRAFFFSLASRMAAAVFILTAKALRSSLARGNSRSCGAFFVVLFGSLPIRVEISEMSLSASGRPAVTTSTADSSRRAIERARKASPAPVNEAIDMPPPGFLPGGEKRFAKSSSAFFIARAVVYQKKRGTGRGRVNV